MTFVNKIDLNQDEGYMIQLDSGGLNMGQCLINALLMILAE